MPAPHILLVEDYKANILVATALLDEFGYSYSVAQNGQQALHLLETQAFDLVLMDVEMPVMDGFETTCVIRSQETQHGHKRLPIIGMTAHALASDRERCLNAGMDDYIAKPFQPNDFQGKLVKYLGVVETANSA